MNPFDDDAADFYVLVNDAGQHSLWPTFRPVPDGWRAVYGPRRRAEALAYVEENWTDITARRADPQVGDGSERASSARAAAHP